MENDGAKHWDSQTVDGLHLLLERGSYKATVKGGSVIDTNNIICPCCGHKMKLRGMNTMPDRDDRPMNYEHREQRDFSGTIRYHESESDSPIDWEMVCPICDSELKIPATEHVTYSIANHDINIV